MKIRKQLINDIEYKYYVKEFNPSSLVKKSENRRIKRIDRRTAKQLIELELIDYLEGKN